MKVCLPARRRPASSFSPSEPPHPAGSLSVACSSRGSWPPARRGPQRPFTFTAAPWAPLLPSPQEFSPKPCRAEFLSLFTTSVRVYLSSFYSHGPLNSTQCVFVHFFCHSANGTCPLWPRVSRKHWRVVAPRCARCPLGGAGRALGTGRHRALGTGRHSRHGARPRPAHSGERSACPTSSSSPQGDSPRGGAPGLSLPTAHSSVLHETSTRFPVRSSR